MCYGEAGPRIRSTVGHPRSECIFRFEEAVERALEACVPGDVLLLSPACTSWDQFPSYEVRGAVFAEVVRKHHG
jgi:UDP-N-acetylmuramoylalanine--D-glutamate ligase